MVVLGDIRDAIANVIRLDFVSAGFSVAALIPVVGDGAAWIKKTNAFIKRADDIPSGAAFRSKMKDIGVSNADKLKLLKEVAPNAVTKLNAANVPDDVIIRLASRMISAKHFDEMVAAAQDIKKAPGKYRLEVDAEDFLRKDMKDLSPLPTQILTRSGDGGVRRFYDVLSEVAGIAKEVKHGRVSGIGRAAIQAKNDRILMDDPRVDIQKVTWDFFTSDRDLVGPDVRLLELLKEKDLDFVLWIG